MHNRMGLNVYGCFGDAPERRCGYLTSQGRGVGECWKEWPAEHAGVAVTPSWGELDWSAHRPGSCHRVYLNAFSF